MWHQPPLATARGSHDLGAPQRTITSAEVAFAVAWGLTYDSLNWPERLRARRRHVRYQPGSK
jgi:hypothetical protein